MIPNQRCIFHIIDVNDQSTTISLDATDAIISMWSLLPVPTTTEWCCNVCRDYARAYLLHWTCLFVGYQLTSMEYRHLSDRATRHYYWVFRPTGCRERGDKLQIYSKPAKMSKDERNYIATKSGWYLHIHWASFVHLARHWWKIISLKKKKIVG